MADQKLTDLTAATSPVDADLLYTVQDVATTPTSKKITWTTIKTFLKTYFDSLTQTLTNKTLNSDTNYIDANATHSKVFLALGRAGVAGDPVYVSGWNVANSCPEVSLARANSTGTMPCAGVLESGGADGTVQSMRIEGILENINTNAWSAGTRLYVSAATAGVLTSTRPTTPNFDQAVATVLFQNATTGILDVIRTAYVGTMAYEDTASYVPKSLYDANSILYATTDNTPVALAVAANNLIGRVAGDIVNIPIDADLTSVSAGDDTVPSAKATKTALDLKAPLTSPTFAVSINGSYLTASQLLATDASKNIVSLAVATYPSLTEISYVKGVTSAIQTQINSKQATLVSATNIKTINSNSLLGSGDLAVAETATTIGSLINGATSKATPVDADLFGYADTEASNVLKKMTWANIKSVLKTYFDTLYSTAVKATGSELDTGTDDAKFATAKALKDSHNVPSVTPGTSGNVLTSNGTDWTSAAPAAASNISTLISTSFEDIARFNNLKSGSAVTTFSNGVSVLTGATSSGYNDLQFYLGRTTAKTLAFKGNPKFSATFAWYNYHPNAAQMYVGIGYVNGGATSNTWTNNHFGFKTTASSGIVSLYATQADGGTENASSALTTLAENDLIDVYAEMTSDTNVKYYWRKNGGAWSSATTLTSNIPASTESSVLASFSSINGSDGQSAGLYLAGFNYMR